MDEIAKQVKTPLFAGIEPGNMDAMLSCIRYHIRTYAKGEIIALEEENIHLVGVVLEGTVDMCKEDFWGSRTMLMRSYPQEIFGETFACGEDTLSTVTFVASEDCTVMFLPFRRIMHTCSHSCAFHQTLVENMVRMIAGKNRDLMRKLDVVSKRTIREKILAYLSIQAQIQKSRYFEIPFGRVELAEYLCVDRSALTRELVKMKEEGLIDYDRNCFRIL